MLVGVRLRATARALPLVAPLVLARLAAAATLVVNDAADAVDVAAGDGVCLTSAGTCTLRAAVLESNATAEADVIELPAGVYPVGLRVTSEDFGVSGDFDVTGDVAIVGAGSHVTSVDALLADRVFHVHAGAHATLSGLLIRGGSAPAFRSGGGVLVDAGSSLHAIDCAFVGNAAFGRGSSIFADDGTAVSLDGCRVDAHSSGVGAAVASDSSTTLVVRNTTFTGNSIGALAGLHLVVAACTFADNGPMGAVEVSGSLLVRQSRFEGNASRGSGGSIHVREGARVVVEDSTFVRSTAGKGGAVGCDDCSGVNLRMERVTITGCRADTTGGALHWSPRSSAAPSELRVVDSTLQGNSAGVSGGALRVEGDDVDASIVVQGSTLSGNVALNGGALSATATQGLTLVLGSTLLDNRAQVGAAIESRGATWRVGVARSVVVAPGGGAPCSGPIASQGHNYFGATSFGLAVDPSDRIGANPLLGPLADNGGSTMTHAPLPGSPLIDAVATGCVDERGAPIATDQRGLPRHVDGDLDGDAACDIGAVELTAGCAADADGDTLGDACDCAPTDASAMLVPGTVDLRVAEQAGDVIVSWPDARALLGSGTTCDVASDSIGALLRARRADGGCVALGIDGPWIDTRPVTDLGWYYLVRATNACGTSGWGRDSLGQARPACP